MARSRASTATVAAAVASEKTVKFAVLPVSAAALPPAVALRRSDRVRTPSARVQSAAASIAEASPTRRATRKRAASASQPAKATDGALAAARAATAKLSAATATAARRNAADAAAMLLANSGHVLTVWSGIAVAAAGRTTTRVVGSFVRFVELTDEEVHDYLATGEPFGVAGAFRIQGRGARLIAARTGCWTNIVGLPTCQTSRLLAPHGIHLRPDGCQTPTAS